MHGNLLNALGEFRFVVMDSTDLFDFTQGGAHGAYDPDEDLAMLSGQHISSDHWLGDIVTHEIGHRFFGHHELNIADECEAQSFQAECWFGPINYAWNIQSCEE
jgi:hypothetical protein